MIFIIRSGFNRFSVLTKGLLRDDIEGTDKYPTIIAKAYELFQSYKMNGLASTSNRSNLNQGSNGDLGGGRNNDNTPRISFAQTGGKNDTIVPGSNGTTLDNLSFRCFKFQKKGYLSNNRPTHNGQQETQFFMMDISFLTLNVENPVNSIIPKSCICLDTCISKSVSNNASMVTNIADCNEDGYLKLHTNII